MSDLPAGWQRKPLEDVAEVILGQSPPGASYNDSGEGIPFFQGKAEFGSLYPSVHKWTTEPKKFAKKDDVLISVRAPVGPTNLAPLDCSVGRGLAALRSPDGMPTKYLLYALRASVDVLASQATGTTFAAVTGKQLRAHEIVVAPPDEQQHIVAAIEEQLSRLDAGVESLQRAKRNLAGLRASILQAAIKGLPTAPLAGRLREPLRNGRSARRSAGGRVRVLTLSAVTEGDFSERNTKMVDLDPDDLDDLWIEPGDLFVERSNTPELVGTAALYRGEPGWAIFPDLLIRVRVDEELDARFLELCLQSPPLRRYFRSRAKGIAGSMPKIDQEVVAATPVPDCSLDRQHAVVEDVERQLSIVADNERTIEQALKRSVALRRSILGAAFAGHLVGVAP